MFKKNGDSQPQARIDCLIGAGARIEGVVRFTGGLRIDGEVKGSVEAADGASSSTLVLSESARVEGSVNVAHLVSNGTIVGPVVAMESLEMQAKARIVGDVEYAAIELHQGAVIEGRLVHRGGKSPELNDATRT